ncbi:MAG TPA: response regulator [Bacteroidia bacterium]
MSSINNSIQPVFNDIMLIDDDVIFVSIFSLMNKKSQFSKNLTTFNNPYAAIEALVQLKEFGKLPELIFLDLNMPLIDGWLFLNQMKELSIETPIVILTSSINETDIIKSKKFHQVKKFISKPVNREKIEEIAEILERVG